MHELSLGQSSKHRNVLHQKTITQDQALNFLMQKQLQLMNGDGDTMAFENLASKTQAKIKGLSESRGSFRNSSNLAKTDRYQKPSFINNSNQLYKQRNNISFSVSAKPTESRRQSIYQNQIAIQGLQNTLQNNQNSQNKQLSQRAYRLRNLSNQRLQTASARIIGQDRKFANKINYNKIQQNSLNQTQWKQLNSPQRVQNQSHTSSIERLSTSGIGFLQQHFNQDVTDFIKKQINENSNNIDNSVQNIKGLRSLRAARPVTAKSSPNSKNKIQFNNQRNMMSSTILNKDSNQNQENNTNISHRNNDNNEILNKYKNFNQTQNIFDLTKNQQSLDNDSSQIMRSQRQDMSQIKSYQNTAIKNVIKKNKISFHNTKAQSSYNHTPLLKKPILSTSMSQFSGLNNILNQSKFSFSPTTFKIQQNIDDTIQSLSENQMFKLYNAKLHDNQLPYQEQAFQHFKNHCTEFCINGKVSLQNQYLGLNSSIQISRLMIKNQLISTYSLSRNKIGDEGLINIANALNQQSHIIKLNLSNNNLSHKGVDYFFTSIINNQSIIDINFDSNEGPHKNNICPKGSESLQQYFIQTQNNSVLNHLSLKCCGLGNQGIKILSSGLKFNKSLLSLCLRGNLMTNSGLKQLIKQLPLSLLELDISDNDINDKGIQTIVDQFYCSNSKVYESSDEEYVIEKDYQNQNSNKIKQIGIDHIDSDSSQIPVLNKLDLSKCRITIQGLENLFTSLMNDGTLKDLNLDNNNFEMKKLSPKFIEKFFVFNNCLEKLYMNNCYLSDQFACNIGKGMHKNIKIQELYLSKNLIDNEGTIEIAKALRFNPNISLRVLDLSYNNLKDLGAKELSQSIRLNQSLENLNIQQNSIYIEGGSYLAYSMMDNKSIRSIKAENNTFYIRYVQKMKEFSKRNQLNFQDNIHPQNMKEHQQLQTIKQQQGMFNKLQSQVQKADQNIKEKLEKTEQVYEEFKQTEEIRYQYLVQKAQDIKEQVRQKDKEYIEAKERILYLEIHGDKQIRELLHFSQNFEKDKAYIQDDIQYYKQNLEEKKQKYSKEYDELLIQIKEIQDKQDIAFRIYKNMELEVKQYMYKHNIKHLNMKNKEDKNDKIMEMQHGFVKMLMETQNKISGDGTFTDYNFKNADSLKGSSIRKSQQKESQDKDTKNDKSNDYDSQRKKKKKGSNSSKSRNSKKRRKSIQISIQNGITMTQQTDELINNSNLNAISTMKSPLSSSVKKSVTQDQQIKK